MFISTYDELRELCGRLAAEPVIAVDTEFIRERTYYPKLCLLQIGTREEQYAIDTIAIKDLSPLKPLFLNPLVTKVFHACSQDLEVLHNEVGCIPEPLFDTQVAAAFLGQRLQLGYGALVSIYTGVRIEKAESLTDWSRRPLDKEQLRYALDDVKYLPDIYDKMIAQLVELDRLNWVLPEMDVIVDRDQLERDPYEAYLHVKRSSTLTRRQLAVLREVAAWREKYAAKCNIPRKWVLSDEILLEVAKKPPTTPERLRRIRGTEEMGTKVMDGLLAAVRKGKNCPPEDYPKLKPHNRTAGDTESVIDLMVAMVRLISEDSGVASALIGSRDDLHEFISRRDESRLATGWRWDLAGKQLDRLLKGEAGLTVKDGRIVIL